MKKISFLLLGGFVLVLSSCLKDSGSTTLTYFKATPVYQDLDQLWEDDLVTEARSIEDPGKIYIGEDFILIGEENEGIHIVDNNDINNPITKAFINIPSNKEFFVEGSTIYAESVTDFVKIDISDLDNVNLIHRNKNVITESIYNDKGEALTKFTFEEVTETMEIGSETYQALNGGQNTYLYYNYLNEIIPSSALPSSFAGSGGSSGAVNRIAVNNDNIYLIDKNRIIVLEDMGSSTSYVAEEYVGSFGDLETIYVEGDLLFLGTTQSVEIMSITNPAQPQYLNQFSHATSCDPVLPKGDVAYVTLRTGLFDRPCEGTVNELVVLDISEPNNIAPTDTEQMKSPYGLSISNTTLYVGEGANGLKIFDITDKFNPSLIKNIENIEAYDIISHPNRSDLILITGPDGLQQFEVSDDLGLDLKSTILF